MEQATGSLRPSISKIAIRLADQDPATASAACDPRFDLARIELQHEQFAEATRDFQTQLANCPDDAETHERLAQAYGSTGRTEDAIAQLRFAIQLAPDVAEYHSLLSQALDASNLNTEALSEAQLTVKLETRSGTNDADDWNNLGVQEARAHHTQAARAAFERALKIEPDHAQARANLARLGLAR